MFALKAFSVPLPESSLHQIYLHSDMFKDNYCNVTPKDVGAFKNFCTLDYICVKDIKSAIRDIAVSDVM